VVFVSFIDVGLGYLQLFHVKNFMASFLEYGHALVASFYV
jgi:hypothetical protein